MKHIKRYIALFLTLALTFCLAFPAAAAFNEDDFTFTTQPQDLYIPRGESFTLSVKLNIPEGVENVSYQWHRAYGRGPYSGYYALVEGATADTLTLSPGDPHYPSFSNQTVTYFRDGGAYRLYQPYICEVTASDADGNQKTILSDVAIVEVEGSFWVKLYGVTVEPFVYAWETGIDMYGFGLVFYPFFLIRRFIDSFNGLF